MTTLIDLTKKARIVLEKKQIQHVEAQIVFAIDISGSMNVMYKSGKIQELLTRLLAVGMNMDDNKSIEVFAFGQGNYEIGTATEGNHSRFVEDILLKKRLEGSTYYAGVMERIIKKFGAKKKLFGGSKTADIPTFVFFVTDGDNFDKPQTEKLIKESSNQAIFWQFIGLGNERFTFLQKLDGLDGRTVDNANFFQANDISKISDEELYDRLLTEFPEWLKEVKEKNILK